MITCINLTDRRSRTPAAALYDSHAQPPSCGPRWARSPLCTNGIRGQKRWDSLLIHGQRKAAPTNRIHTLDTRQSPTRRDDGDATPQRWKRKKINQNSMMKSLSETT